MKVLRLKDVKEKTGLGRSSIYDYMKEGTFPKSIKLGERAVGWVADEVDLWLRKRLEARDG